MNSAQPAPFLGRILVVDDEQYMCDVCSRTLQRSGYEVLTTCDPDAAVRLLQGELSFDLLLTDIKMPTMSGLDLAHIARDRDPAIAIIIMTGFASKENLQQSVQRGVADFLPKPFELDQLRLAVEQALHKRGLLQDNLRLRALEQMLAHSEALISTLNVQELGATLLRIALEQSGGQFGFVLVNAERPVTISSHAGTALLPGGRRLAQKATVQRRLQQSGDEPLGTMGGHEASYGIATALYAQGEITGVLVICYGQVPELRLGAQEELALLSNHAGTALRNAVLYSQLDEAYARLKDLDKLKGEFIAVASHELRTPLSLVLGYTMMLRDQSTTDTQRDYLGRVLENGERIRGIVDDMISLRHLDMGQANLSADQIVLGDLLKDACSNLGPLAQEHALTLSFTPSEPPITLVSDREKVQLIAGHLISNAVRFTPPGGKIDVRASLQPAEQLKGHTPTGRELSRMWAVVEVEDTGVGIPEREQLRIFERFYQVEESLTREHGGIGLGLAIVRELTAVLGGMVWLQSKEGQGSTFTVALPVA